MAALPAVPLFSCPGFFAFHQSVEICANLWIELFEASSIRGLARYSTAIFDLQVFTEIFALKFQDAPCMLNVNSWRETGEGEH